MLERAFAYKESPVVALIINSPGGSPVQSNLIYQRIRSLAKEKNKKVIAFAEDAAASGGYMIACAADEIFVDPSSIVGSIVVVSSSFGFVEALKKLGVERLLHLLLDARLADHVAMGLVGIDEPQLLVLGEDRGRQMIQNTEENGGILYSLVRRQVF